jgi:hypothetical protein
MNEHIKTINPQSSTHQHNFSIFLLSLHYTTSLYTQMPEFYAYNLLDFRPDMFVVQKVETRIYHCLYLESPALRCLQKNIVRQHSLTEYVN